MLEASLLMMEAPLFESSCFYLRLMALVLGLILFIIGMLVLFRPLARQRLYGDDSVNSRAVKLYMKTQQEEKGHLVWMLIIFAVVVWFAGAIVSSSYLTDYVINKNKGCEAGSQEASSYSEYNNNLIYLIICFGAGVILNLLGTVTSGNTSRVLHGLSYLFLLLGTILTILQFRYLDICSVSAKCM
jgi:hypothetical protein